MRHHTPNYKSVACRNFYQLEILSAGNKPNLAVVNTDTFYGKLSVDTANYQIALFGHKRAVYNKYIPGIIPSSAIEWPMTLP